jgi:hypothetical protein
MSTTTTAQAGFRRWAHLGSQVPHWAKGRVCAEEGCDTVLSVYNRSIYCAVHARVPDESLLARTPVRPLRRAACEQCGAEFETANPARRFCSARCRVAAFEARRRSAPADVPGHEIDREPPGTRPAMPACLG